MIVRRHFEMGQTAATVLCEELHYDSVATGMADARHALEEYILSDPMFSATLEPHAVPSSAPRIVRQMSAAASLAGVGPMAAVAGAIAQHGVEAAERAGCSYCVVDNGGDISMLLDREQMVGLFCGDRRFSRLAFRCRPGERASICTSSGTVGPSISFGVADAAVVAAKDACLADACATRLGNEVMDLEERTLRRALGIVAGIEGVEGCMVVAGGRLALQGRLPELVEAPESADRVSRIQLNDRKMSGLL
jgi:ApbE superfamily uncharacterized protein (UPF0280 family)